MLKNIVVGVLLGTAQLFLGLGIKKPTLGAIGMSVQLLAALASSVLSLVIFPVYLFIMMACEVTLKPGAIKNEQAHKTKKIRFCIEGLDGPLRGCSYILSEATSAEFGREGCTVLFPPSSPGVGRHHCRVYISGGDAFLADNNSTYGTFLTPERKLPSGATVKLENGSMFYLAEKKNLFRIIEI